MRFDAPKRAMAIPIPFIYNSLENIQAHRCLLRALSFRP